MRRRALLTSAVAGVSIMSGCGEITNDNAKENEMASVSQSTLDTESPLEYNLELVNSDISTEPVQIRITLTNTSEEEYKYGEARNAKFIGASAVDRGEFVLYPEEFSKDNYSIDNETGVWLSDEYLSQTADFQIGSLEGGESASVVLFLLHKPTNEDEPSHEDSMNTLDWFHESANEDDHVSSYPESISFASEISVYEGEKGPFDEEGKTTSNIKFTLDLDI